MPKIKPNRLVLKLISANFFLYAGWGLIAPIFAIFVTDQIEGGSIEMVGFAVGLHWIVKSTIQPFLAYRMDVIKGEHDDVRHLLRGMVLSTIVPFFYIFATQMWHIFILEAIRGVGLALVQPAWCGIFTRHIDKNWEAYTWSLQSTTMGYAWGFSAAFGGLIAALVGFDLVFIGVAFFSGISTLFVRIMAKDPWLKSGEE